MQVRIDHEAGGEKGQLIIRYDNLDDLDMLCRLLSRLPENVGSAED
jgi:ParB family chromosome partitioning protein